MVTRTCGAATTGPAVVGLTRCRTSLTLDYASSTVAVGAIVSTCLPDVAVPRASASAPSTEVIRPYSTISYRVHTLPALDLYN